VTWLKVVQALPQFRPAGDRILGTFQPLGQTLAAEIGP
jgi:hypothetical protein